MNTEPNLSGLVSLQTMKIRAQASKLDPVPGIRNSSSVMTIFLGDNTIIIFQVCPYITYIQFSNLLLAR